MDLDMSLGMDIGGDVRNFAPPPPLPTLPTAAAPATPTAPGQAPGAGVLPPGYGTNPQDVMRMIMQMMLSQSLGSFFNPNARGPSAFTPGTTGGMTGFAPPAPPGVPGPFPQVGPISPPSMPWSLPGLVGGGPGSLPTSHLPGSNPNLAYASGAPAPSLNPGDTSGLAPSQNWDLRGRMPFMIPEMQGASGGMNSPYAFLSELLRQMAQGGWPTNV